MLIEAEGWAGDQEFEEARQGLKMAGDRLMAIMVDGDKECCQRYGTELARDRDYANAAAAVLSFLLGLKDI